MKKIMLWILVLILLAGAVQGADLMSNISGCWSFDQNTSADIGMYNFTASGAVLNTSSFKVGSGAYTCDGVDDFLTTSVDPFPPFDGYSKDQSFSISIWIRTSAFTDSEDPFVNWANSNQNHLRIDTSSLEYWTGAAAQISNDSYNSIGWNHVVIVHNGSGANEVTVYQNGDSIGGGTDGSGWNADPIRLCTTDEVNQWYGGDVDELVIWNRSIDKDEIDLLYANDAGLSCDQIGAPPPAGGSTINISFPYPLNGTGWNTQSLNINATVNSSYVFDCSLYINNTLNQTQSGLTNLTTDVLTNFTVPFSATEEQDFNYFIQCWSPGEGINSSNNTVFIDNVDPLLIWDAEFSGETKTVFDLQNLTGWIVYEDTSLFSYNISIDDVLVYNQSNLIVSDLNVSISYNASGLSAGLHNVTSWICDGHTDKKIPEWNNNNANTELLYSFDNDWIKIIPKNKNLLKKLDTTKMIDRYTFDLEFKQKPPNTVKFSVLSNKRIDINAKNQYAGHLVIEELHKWIDFENDDGSTATTKKINDNEVEVTLHGLKNKDVKIKSIGELNCINQTREFYKINWTEAWTNPIIEQSTSLIYLNVTTNTSFIGDMNATVYYNGSSFPYTGTLSNNLYSFIHNFTLHQIVDQNVNFSFYWTIDADGKITNTSNKTQQAYQMNVGNCSAGGAYAYNFTFYDETDESRILGADFEATFDFWNSFINKNTTINTTNTDHVDVCVYPAWATFNTNATIQYNKDLYDQRNYYLVHATANNDTQNISLYLLNSSLSSLINLDLVDQGADDVEGAIIKVLKYYVGQNYYRTVAMSKTDFNGRTGVYINKYDTIYKFLVDVDAINYKETTQTEVFADTLYFSINTEGDIFESVDGYTNTIYNLTFINTTTPNYFQLAFYDTTGIMREACLHVVRLRYSGEETICETCLTTNAGLILCNVTDDNSSRYIAKAQIDTNTTGTWYLLESLEHYFGEDYQTYANYGVFFTFLIVGGLAFLGLWNPAVAMILTIVALLFSVFLNFIYLSYASLALLIIVGGIIIFKVKT